MSRPSSQSSGGWGWVTWCIVSPSGATASCMKHPRVGAKLRFRLPHSPEPLGEETRAKSQFRPYAGVAGIAPILSRRDARQPGQPERAEERKPAVPLDAGAG